MARFRKKPVVVDAMLNTGAWSSVIEFLRDVGYQVPFGSKPAITRNEDGTLNITTLEGVMTADVGDWIIRGVKGELYPCKPDIFEATYEKARDFRIRGFG